MVKSLILSALLSFSTASYEFDCSEIFLNRNNSIDTISITNSNDELLIIDTFGNVNTDLFENLTYTGNTYVVNLSFDEDTFGFSDDGESVYNLLTITFDIDEIVRFAMEDFALTLEYVDNELDMMSYTDNSYQHYLCLAPNSTFTYTGDGADILNQVFINYIDGADNTSVLSEIGDVLLWVPSQFVSLFSTLTAVFYSNGALTLPGLFLVISLGVFICALILDFILKFRKI